MTDLIRCDIRDGLCTITLNRPEKLNALNVEAFRQLASHIDTIETAGDAVQCILLKGEGRSFCAGHDLKGIAEGSEGSEAKRLESGTIERLAELDIPVVAAVRGHCLTGGLELVLAADIIIAAESARFADTHGRWDLVPVWGLSQRLPRRIGRARALEMMLASRSYDGHAAVAMGLANLCVPDDALDAAAQEMVRDIMQNAARANRAVKRLLRETEGLRLRAGIAYELHHTAGRGPEMAGRIARRGR
jgi:enoyl-CoA hydratase/carnithine racemase